MHTEVGMLLTFPSPSFPELILFVETRMALPGTERHRRNLEEIEKSANLLLQLRIHRFQLILWNGWESRPQAQYWNSLFFLPWAPVTSLSRETLRAKPGDFSAVAVTEPKRSKHNIFHPLFFYSISHFCSHCIFLICFSSFFSDVFSQRAESQLSSIELKP